MAIGLAVAGAACLWVIARARRISALLGVVAVITATLFAPLMIKLAVARADDARKAAQLTGQTRLWSSNFSARKTFDIKS